MIPWLQISIQLSFLGEKKKKKENGFCTLVSGVKSYSHPFFLVKKHKKVYKKDM